MTNWWASRGSIAFAASLETVHRVDTAAAHLGLTRSGWMRQAAIEKLARDSAEQKEEQAA